MFSDGSDNGFVSDSSPESDDADLTYHGSYTGLKFEKFTKFDDFMKALEKMGYEGDIEDNDELDETKKISSNVADAKAVPVCRKRKYVSLKAVKKYKTRKDCRKTGIVPIVELDDGSDSEVTLTAWGWRQLRRHEHEAWMEKKNRKADAKAQKIWENNFKVLLGQ